MNKNSKEYEPLWRYTRVRNIIILGSMKSSSSSSFVFVRVIIVRHIKNSAT